MVSRETSERARISNHRFVSKLYLILSVPRSGIHWDVCFFFLSFLPLSLSLFYATDPGESDQLLPEVLVYCTSAH